jgi:iron(III) transport system substrate-binding protein
MKSGRLVTLLVVLVLAVGAWLFWPRQKVGLTLYSAVSYGPSVAEAFTQQTGIPVSVISLSTGPLLARISAEGRRPTWSVAWFDGSEAAAALDNAGLLAKGTTPDLDWTPLGRSLLPKDGAFTPTGASIAGVFTYRADMASAPPTRWDDLLKPGFAGRFGMNNPSISGPTYPLLSGMLYDGGGWPAGKALIQGLKSNGMRIYPTNGDTLAALQHGDIDIAIIQSSAAFVTVAHNPAYRVQLPASNFVLPSVMIVANGQSAQQLALAERFIRFAMSPDMQKMRLSQPGYDSLYWPVTKDAPPPSATLPALGTIVVKALDPYDWGSREAQVNAWFSQEIVQK